MYHWSVKGRDNVICGAFFRTVFLSSQNNGLSADRTVIGSS
jgi:hypothetical protein